MRSRKALGRVDRAAGLLILRPSDFKVLLVRRSRHVSRPGRWSVPGGEVERGELDIQAALREAREELGALPSLHVFEKPYRQVEEDGFVFSTFLGEPVSEGGWFVELNEENDGYDWFNPGDLPAPLMPGTREAIAKLLGDRREIVMGIASISRWTRCGNSLFFQIRAEGGGPFDLFFINPIDWTVITASQNYEEIGEGSALIVGMRAPRYDAKIAKEGIESVFSPSEEKEILTSLERWADIRDTALEGHAAPKDLVSYLDRKSSKFKDSVFAGIRGLVGGWESMQFEEAARAPAEPWVKPVMQTRMRLAMEVGSRAHQSIREVERVYGVDEPSVLGKDLNTAFWHALEQFGIFEC